MEKLIKKKLLWFAFLLIAATQANAIGYKSVVVTLHDGSSSKIDLTDGMKTTFDGTNVVFADDVFLVEFEKSQVSKFEFSETTGINNVETSDANVNFKDGILTLTGMPDKSKVAIYTVAGIGIETIEFSRNCDIDLNNLQSGVYIVNINNVSYKIAISK